MDIKKTQNTTTLSGYLQISLGVDIGKPNIGCYTVLYDEDNDRSITDTTTNQFGFWSFSIDNESLPPGKYSIRFFKSDAIQKFKDQGGDWEAFEIVATGRNVVVDINSSNGEVFHHRNGSYQPLDTVLEITVQNIENPTYVWKKGEDVIVGETTSVLPVTAGDIFSQTINAVSYSCTVSGNNEGIPITPITKSISLSRIVDGTGLVFRGVYDVNSTYFANDTRTDVVLYNGDYYYCVVDNTTGAWNASNWVEGENEFDFVATDIFLTKDANIMRTLVMGTLEEGMDTYYGSIRSANVSGLYTKDPVALENKGFFFSEEGGGIARIGEADGTKILKGFVWDGEDPIVKGTNFELTKAGELWARAGGFGGIDPANPKILINEAGLVAKEGNITRALFTDSSIFWNNPPSAEIDYLNASLHEPDFESVDPLTNRWIITVTGTSPTYVCDKYTDVANKVLRIQITDSGYHTSGAVVKAKYKNPSNLIDTGNTTGTNRSYYISFNYKTNVSVVNLDPYTTVSAKFRLLDDVGTVLKEMPLSEVNSEGLYDNIGFFFITNERYLNFEYEVNRYQWLEFFGDPPTLADPVYLYVDDLEVGYYEPFVSISKEGFYAFQTPGTYFKAGIDEFAFVGADLDVTSLVVRDSLIVLGQTYSAANNLAGTTSHLFTIGTNDNDKDVELRFGSFANQPRMIWDYSESQFDFNKNLKISGNLNVTGIITADTLNVTTITHSETVEIDDNLLIINNGETGAGVTAGIAGIEVERGTETNYQFVFMESPKSFRIGEVGNLQSVATRQDTPVSQGVSFWNNTSYRFDTHANLIWDNTDLKVNTYAVWHSNNLTDLILLGKIKNVDSIDSGLDADLLDTQHGSYYRNASNLNAGTLPDARLTGAYTGITTLSMSGQLTNTVAIGTSPFVITSTTVNTNLNADLWDGYQFADYLNQAVKTTSSPSLVRLTLSQATGTAPLTVSSTTVVTNLNADLIDGVHLSGLVQTSRSVLAGNGLTGGGTLANDVTITMGTPSTLTSATTNATTATSHTHAITTYDVSGTANQVTVTAGGKVLGNAITFSLPQDIHTGATPGFYGIDSTRYINVTTPSANDILQWSSTTTVGRMRKITDQGGLLLATDSSMLLHAGDNGLNIISDLNIVAGSTEETLLLTADNLVRVITNRQTDYASSYTFTFNADGRLSIPAQATQTYHALIAGRNLTMTGTTNQISISAGTQNLTADRTWTFSLPQNIHTGASPTFATGKFTNLTDGYLPYHISDASGLGNSVIYTNGTNVGIGTTSPQSTLHLSSSTNPKIFLDGGSSLKRAFISVPEFENRFDLGSDTDGVDIVFWTKPVSGSLTEKLTIASSGNVGIGTTSPGSKLHISADALDVLRIQRPSVVDNAIAGIMFQSSATSDVNSAYIGSMREVDSAGRGTLVFGTVSSGSPIGAIPTEKMRISENGNVGIGTTAPGAKLEISGTEDVELFRLRSSSGAYVTLYPTNTREWDLRAGSSANYKLSLLNIGTGNFDFTVDGNVGIGTTAPDTGTLGADKVLHINSATAPSLRLSATAGADYQLVAYAGDLRIFDETANAYRFTLGNDGNVGIGTTSPDGKLNVVTADSGATANAFADELVIENSVSSGISILSGNANTGNIYFGDAENNDVGAITYNHSDNSLVFDTADENRLFIKSDGNVGIGTTSPASVIPNASISNSTWLQVSSNATTTDSGILLRRSDNVTGLDLWSDNNVGVAYIDNRYDADTAYTHFRTKTAGTPITAMTIKGNGYVGINRTDPSYPLHVEGDGYFNGWVRTAGAKGWYNQTYGGGWYMTDSTWIQNYGSKGLLINSNIQLDTNSTYIGSSGAGGFGQYGSWRIDKGIATTGRSTMYLDNLWIRGTMNVYELLVQQIRATNGSVWVSSTGKIEVVNGSLLTIVDTSGSNVCGFAVGDFIYAKRVYYNGGTQVTLKEIVRKVTNVAANVITVTTVAGFSDTGTIEVGDEFVRLGNETDLNRQGSVYISADDLGAPFIRVYDGVSSYIGGTEGTNFGDFGTLKAQLGKLTNITSPIYGGLKGYGLYTQNAYLEGNVNVAGTLTAGDANGFGNTFYAGRINKNLLRSSNNFSVNWTIQGGSIVSSSEQGPDGQFNATEIEFTLVPNNFYLFANDEIEVTPNSTYTFSFYMKAGTVSNPRFAIRDQINSIWISYDTTEEEYSPTSEWVRVSHTFDIPGDCNRIRVYLLRTASTNGTLLFSSTQLEQGSEATSYQPTDGTLISGYGSELVTNGDFSNGTTGWNKAESYGDISNDNGQLKITRTSSGTYTNLKAYQDFPIEEGRTYTLTFNSKGEDVDAGVWSLYDVSNSAYYRTYVSTGNSTSTYTTISFTFVSNGTSARLQLAGNDSDTLTSVYYDNVSVKEVLPLEYGMWAVNGGFGGTIQNPVVGLYDYGLKIRNANHVASLEANSIMIGNITGTANSALKLTNTGTNNTSGLYGYTSAGTESFALRLDGTANIAGWLFDNVKFYKGTTFELNSNTEELKIGTGASASSTTGMYFKSDGTFNLATNASNYIRKNGTLLEILSQDFELNSGSLAISGNTTSSYIKLGTLADATTTATTNSGFRVDNSGNILLKGNVSGSNYIKVTGTGSIDINSTTFNLTSGNLYLVGNSTSSYLRLGSLTSTDPNTTNIGLYGDNSGNVLIKAGTSANTNYLRFLSNAMTIDSTAFTLKGSTTLYIDTTKIAIGTSASANTVASTSVGTVFDNAGLFKSYLNATNYIRRDGSSLDIKATVFDLVAGSLKVYGSSTSSYIKLGATTGITDTTNQGTWIDNSGNLMSFGNADNYIQRNGTTLTMKSNAFTLKGSTTLYLDTTKLALGTSASGLTVAGTSVGTVIDNAGGFLSYGSATNYIRRSGTTLDIKSSTFSLVSGNMIINNSTGIQIDSDNYWWNDKKFRVGGAQGIDYNGSVLNIGTDVNISGTLAVGSIPNLPSDEYLTHYFNFDGSLATNNIDPNYNFIVGGTGETQINGISGKAFGSNHTAYLNSNNNYILDPTDEGAISLWVYFDNILNVGCVFHLYEGGGTDYIRSYFNSNGNHLDFVGESNNVSIFSFSCDLDNIAGGFQNKWLHLVYTRYSGKSYIYVNGEELASSVTSHWTNHLNAGSRVLNIGDGSWGTPPLYAFDEVRVYNKGLTPNEVKALYLNPSGQKGTVVSGNQVKTGQILSNSWTGDATVKGTKFDLDNGLLWMRYNSQDVFKFNSETGSALLSGWNIDYYRIYSSNKAVQLRSDRSSLFINTSGSVKEVSVGQTYDGSAWTGNYGLAVVDSSDNYLFRADSGGTSIAGWNFTTSELTGTNARLRSSGVLSLGSADGWVTANSIYIDGASSRMSIGSGFQYTGGSLTINGSASIAGWNITSGSINKDMPDNYGLLSLDSGNGSYRIRREGSGSIVDISMGNTYNGDYTAKYGFLISVGGTSYFEVTKSAFGVFIANIAGWSFNETQLYNSTNIILDSSAKSISINSATWGADGIQLQYNAGNPRAYIGNGSNRYFNFDGTNVSWEGANTSLTTAGLFTASNAVITGNVTANTLTATSSGTIANWTISSSSLSTGAFNTLNTMYFGTSGISLSNTFSVTAAGALTATNATITGVINANTGYFGGATNGWSIAAGIITATGTGLIRTSSTTTRVELDSTGLKAYNAGTQRVQILSDGSGWLGSSSDFSWTNAGVLSVNKVTATSGTVGAFTIDSNSIFSGTKTLTGNYTASVGHLTIGSDGHISAYQFRIDADGSAYFKGNITGASGTFSGSLNASGKITASNVSVGGAVSGDMDGLYIDANNKWLKSATKTQFQVGGSTGITYDSLSSSTITLGSTVVFNTGTTNGIKIEGKVLSLYSGGQRLDVENDGLNRLSISSNSTDKPQIVLGGTSYDVYMSSHQGNVRVISKTNSAAAYLAYDEIYLNNSSGTKVFSASSNGNTTITGVMTASSFVGSLPNHSADLLTSGTVPMLRLGSSGTRAAGYYLNGAGEWTAMPTSGWTGSATSALDMNGYSISEIDNATAEKYFVKDGSYPNNYTYIYPYNNSATMGFSHAIYVGGIGYFTGDVYANYSDIRLKENIQTVENALDIIKKIRAVTFNWNSNELVINRNHSKDIGFIAQEVDAVFSLAVAPFTDSGYFTVDKTKMIPLMLRGIQENASEIDKLKEKVRKLELENEELKMRLN